MRYLVQRNRYTIQKIIINALIKESIIFYETIIILLYYLDKNITFSSNKIDLIITKKNWKKWYSPFYFRHKFS